VISFVYFIFLLIGYCRLLYLGTDNLFAALQYYMGNIICYLLSVSDYYLHKMRYQHGYIFIRSGRHVYRSICSMMYI